MKNNKNNIEEVIEDNDIFKEFENIYIEDSSIIKFNKIKPEFFKGSGGSKTTSSFKLNLIFNMAKMSIKDIVYINLIEVSKGYLQLVRNT